MMMVVGSFRDAWKEQRRGDGPASGLIFLCQMNWAIKETLLSLPLSLFLPNIESSFLALRSALTPGGLRYSYVTWAEVSFVQGQAHFWP